MQNKNVYPYYDTSADQYAKGYKQVMFVPGKVVQARELTESQSLQIHQGIDNWNTLYKNGSIVSGCDLTIDLVLSTCTLSRGQFFFDGRVLAVDEQVIDIDGVDTENLGLYVSETFVTHYQDTTLTDPAKGVSNYGLDGSHRNKLEVLLKKIIPVADPKVTLPANQMYADENNLTQVWDLLDGVVQNYIRKPDYSLLSQTLAKRTYDESGNYLVEGMTLQTEESSDSSKIKVVVSPGISYVKGFDNTFIVPRSIDVDKALVTQDHLIEPHAYETGTDEYLLIRPYVVTDELVKPVTVIAEVDETIVIDRGSGDFDAFEDIYGTVFTSIESILSISGYVEGVDYELSSEMIHWIGSKPATGVDYTVNFRYFKNAVRDTDYELVKDETTDAYYISWTNTGDIPADGTNVLVSYSTYKARTDLISIDKFGAIVQKRGVDVNWDETLIPPFSDEMLPLGWIKFLPGKDHTACVINEYMFKRTTMMELHRLKKRVNDLEENVATLALERETQEGELASSLKGMFVDNFTMLYKADIIHPDYYAATNLIDGELCMVSESKELDFNRANDTRTKITQWNNAFSTGKFLTPQKLSEQTFFENVLKSDTMNLNPHGFIKLNPAAYLTPDSDNWVNTEVRERTVIENVVRETITNIHQLQWVMNPTNETQLNKDQIVNIGNKVGTEKVEIGDRLVTYARRRQVLVKGSNFEPASTLTGMFGGVLVPLTAVSPYRNLFTGGVNTNKVIVASDGSFQATFMVPNGVKNGNIEMMFVDEYGNKATVIYQSKGVTKIIENRTTITKLSDKIIDIYEIITPERTPIVPPVLPPIIPDNPGGGGGGPEMMMPRNEDVTRDPLAQSFIFKDDKVLTSIDLFFATKADDKAKPVVQDDYYNTSAFQPTIPAILQIGYMKNGSPDARNIIYYQEILPAEITTSLYGDTPTRISFKKPIYIPAMQDFYISIGSKSTEYSVYVSVLGQEDITSGNVIMKQPYQDGTLFTSSNGITWTPEQDRDMTIRLYEGVYEAEGEIVTENITFPNDGWAGYGRFLFMQKYTEVPNTDVQYYYSQDNGTTWTPFNPSDEINSGNLNLQLKIKIAVKSAMNTAGQYVLAPIVHIASNLVFFRYDTSVINQYRMKETTGIPAYNNVKIILDENLSSGTSILKEFSCFTNSGGQIWFRLVNDAIESIDIGSGYFRKTFVFDFMLLQKLTVDTLTGFAVGDSIEVYGETNPRGKICYLDTINSAIYVMLTDSNVDRFSAMDEVTVEGVYTAEVSSVDDYTSDPTWPTIFTGRILMESTSFWKTPSIKNYRSIQKAVG